MSEPDSPDTPQISMVEVFARGTKRHPRLTLLVMFMTFLLTIGTAAIFMIIAFRLSAMDDGDTPADAPVVTEQDGP